MSTRLSIISTRTGDDGTTGLGDGSRLPKTAPLIHALGDVDELNSHIGVLRSMALPEDVDSLLSDIQHDLFDMGAELCIPGHQVIGSAHVERLDQAIRHYNEPLGILKEFILPGGSPAAAQAHVLRCVARRAERSVVAVPSEALPQDGPRLYLNRLSDLLFVLARILNRHAGRSDVLWEPKRNETDKD